MVLMASGAEPELLDIPEPGNGVARAVRGYYVTEIDGEEVTGGETAEVSFAGGSADVKITVSHTADEARGFASATTYTLHVTEGVASAVVNFMTQKMIVEFTEGSEPKTVMQNVLKACKKVEPDCEIEL